jgi:periplasmic copper chaperone A
VKRLLVCVLAIGSLLSSCSVPLREGLEVREAWARPAAQGDNGAVYFVIRSSQADEIVGASTEVAEAAEIHQSTLNGDVMEMHHAPTVPLGAGEELTFEPGGLHIMLVGLKQALEGGDAFDITLHFKQHEDLEVSVAVRDGSASHEDHETEIEQNKHKWQDQGISHYRFHLTVGCFCAFSQDMPLIIEVQDGKVVSMEYQSGKDIDPGHRELFKKYETIDRIFDELEAGLNGAADQVTVKYDPTYGFPAEATIDVVKEAADDELYLTISDFEALP